MKKINIKEFREFGYLQEVNRRFLHPLGLALEVVIDDDDGTEYLGGIWDYRDDSEGIIYDLDNSDKDRIESFKKKAQNINKEFLRIEKSRREKLGYHIEPIK